MSVDESQLPALAPVKGIEPHVSVGPVSKDSTQIKTLSNEKLIWDTLKNIQDQIGALNSRRSHSRSNSRPKDRSTHVRQKRGRSRSKSRDRPSSTSKSRSRSPNKRRKLSPTVSRDKSKKRQARSHSGSSLENFSSTKSRYKRARRPPSIQESPEDSRYRSRSSFPHKTKRKRYSSDDEDTIDSDHLRSGKNKKILRRSNAQHLRSAQYDDELERTDNSTSDENPPDEDRVELHPSDEGRNLFDVADNNNTEQSDTQSIYGSIECVSKDDKLDPSVDPKWAKIINDNWEGKKSFSQMKPIFDK